MFTHSPCAPRRREKQPTPRIPVRSGCVHVGSWAARWLIIVAMVVISDAAQAHGIVGNRLFPSTLPFGGPAVGGRRPEPVQPGFFFGKAFGELPSSLSWLRPLAITGAVRFEHPMAETSTNFGIDPQTGQLGPMLTRNVDTMHWGFSIQY